MLLILHYDDRTRGVALLQLATRCQRTFASSEFTRRLWEWTRPFWQVCWSTTHSSLQRLKHCHSC